MTIEYFSEAIKSRPETVERLTGTRIARINKQRGARPPVASGFSVRRTVGSEAKTEENEEKARQPSAAKKVLNSIRRRGDNDDGEVEGLQVLSIVDARNGLR